MRHDRIGNAAHQCGIRRHVALGERAEMSSSSSSKITSPSPVSTWNAMPYPFRKGFTSKWRSSILMVKFSMEQIS